MEETLSHDAVFKALLMLKRVRRLEGTVLLHEGVLMNADTLLNERQVKDFVVEVNALISQFRNGGRPLFRALIGFDGGNVLLLNARPYTLCLLFARINDAGTIERAAEEFFAKWADALHLAPGSNLEPPAFDIGEWGLAATVGGRETVVTPSSEPPPPAARPIPPVSLSEPEVDPEAFVVPAETMIGSPAVEGVSRAAGTPGKVPEWQPFRLQVENLLSKVLGRAQATRLIDRELEGMGIAPGGHPSPSQFRPFGMRLLQKIKDKALRRQIEIEFIARVEDHLS